MKVLMVVDMINAFAHKNGSLFFPDAEKIISFVKEKINEYIKEGWFIFFLCDEHDKNDKEFERFPEHAVKDTWEAEIIDALKQVPSLLPDRVHIVKKQRYSAFYNTTLDDLIKIEEIQDAEFEFVGVCTGICDMDTIGDFANRDMKTGIYEEGVADLPNIAYDLEDLNMPVGKVWMKRMSFLYGTKIL